MLDFAFIVGGLALLFFAGDLLVKGAVSAGLKYAVPPLIIGLTIVAFGTSAPELFVTVQASFSGSPEIAVGNVIGSNIANVLLVLGLPALLAPLADHSNETKRNYVIMMAVTAVSVGLMLTGPLTWWQGALLLGMLGLFLLDAYRCAIGARATDARTACDTLPEELEDGDPSLSTWRIAALVLGGAVGLAIGADLAVMGAIGVSESFGVDKAAIGLTMVALGTSLPELATTVMAARNNRADVAIGNVIGSNVFNLLCILGVAATLGEIAIPVDFWMASLAVMIISAVAMAPFILMRLSMNRVAGGVFVAAYLGYVVAVLSPTQPASAAGAASGDLTGVVETALP